MMEEEINGFISAKKNCFTSCVAPVTHIFEFRHSYVQKVCYATTENGYKQGRKLAQQLRCLSKKT